MAFIDGNSLEIFEERSPLVLVVLKNPQVKHVRVRQQNLDLLAYGSTLFGRCISVVSTY
jgi:hypothetical protein